MEKIFQAVKNRNLICKGAIEKADIVLLDEVTSDLDGEAERQVCDLMEEIAKKAIVLNISHKPESIRRSEKFFYARGKNNCRRNT